MGKRIARTVLVFLFVVAAVSGGEVAAQGQPEGQLTIAFDTAIAPSTPPRVR